VGRLRLRLAGPSLHGQLRWVRLRVAEWAASVGMGQDGVDDLVLATYEALANVADHAYPDGPGDAWVEAGHAGPGELTVVVSDRGRWRTPPADPGLRGRGMKLIAALADRVAVHRGASGTSVVMHWRCDLDPDPGVAG
jgi:serine/threonine-protein kinase RsbW